MLYRYNCSSYLYKTTHTVFRIIITIFQRLPSETYRERITTSTGEVIGGFKSPGEATQRKVLIDVNGALRNRKRKKDKTLGQYVKTMIYKLPFLLIFRDLGFIQLFV